MTAALTLDEVLLLAQCVNFRNSGYSVPYGMEAARDRLVSLGYVVQLPGAFDFYAATPPGALRLLDPAMLLTTEVMGR